MYNQRWETKDQQCRGSLLSEDSRKTLSHVCHVLTHHTSTFACDQIPLKFPQTPPATSPLAEETVATSCIALLYSRFTVLLSSSCHYYKARVPEPGHQLVSANQVPTTRVGEMKRRRRAPWGWFRLISSLPPQGLSRSRSSRPSWCWRFLWNLLIRRISASSLALSSAQGFSFKDPENQQCQASLQRFFSA